MTAPVNRRPSPQQVRAGRREIARRYSRHRPPLNYNAKRRREIERYGEYVVKHLGADTDLFRRVLTTWSWHLPKSANPLQAVMNCAARLGREITERQALAVLSSIAPRRWKADPLGRYLEITLRVRTALGITTIGACDFSKRERRKQRKHRDQMYQERKRRAAGARPQSESLSATQPWRTLGMSRRTWYRWNKPRTGTNGTTSSAAFFLIPTDRVVPTERKKEEFEAAAKPPRGLRPRNKKERGYPSSQTATTMAADSAASSYSGLPLELRLIALGLAASKNFAPKIGIAA
jgi:hypothetical protein